MKFTIFDSAKAQKGQPCTLDMFTEYSLSPRVEDLCIRIAREEDPEKRGILKKGLPVITWQAAFDGRRVNKEAKPSGLFMLDIDHVDNPGKFYEEKLCGTDTKTRLGIMYVGMTASRHGLRIVAKCRKEYSTIEQCQRWLASELGTEYDSCCKDWARSSFVVHDSYTYYIDGAIFTAEPEEGTVYSVEQAAQPNIEMEEALRGNFNYDNAESPDTDQREGLFGGPEDYNGISYEQIAKEWLESTGGEPIKGTRNTRLYQLATRMRYITDFNESTLLRVLPRYGLSEDEMRQLIHSAAGSTRAQSMPLDLQDVLKSIERRKELSDSNVDLAEEIITDTEKTPRLPPLLRQWWEIAPEDFKTPVVLCQLPILGALGSRLRSTYLDGKVHSPSFQVSLEAPQASGKSFIVRLVNYELALMMAHDEEEREKERAYSEKAAEMKLLNIKVTAENKDEILGTKPKSIIRYVPATMSITKLLMRMENAQGLHLFALAEEVDTVLKAFKRGFSSFSDALRVSFDNGLYGQDYASDNSFSGIIPLYYNTLFSGTPKAMRRFYPDVEDGLVSRVLFVTFPDQFGKKMPIWATFTEEQKRVVDVNLVRLNEISIQGDEVQPEHHMKLNFLNKALEEWIGKQQALAVKDNDRTRDIFCRRAAVVGFRAGMLAFFLWGEKATPPIRRNTIAFAIWVANNMLNQHMLRFNVTESHSNVNKWEDVFNKLGDTFTREDCEKALTAAGYDSPVKTVLYKWRLLGVIQETRTEREDKRNKKTTVEFKKTV